MRSPITHNQFILTSPSDAGGKDARQLGREKIYRWLGLELAHAPALAAASNLPANILRGDEWAALEKLTIYANGQDSIFTASGDDLWLMNYLLFDGYPPITEGYGDGTTANPACQSNLLVPFMLPGAFKPSDTNVDSSRFQSFSVEAQFGSYSSIAAAASGWTTRPTLRVYSHEGWHTPRPEDDPIFAARINKLSQAYSGANSSAQFELERGQLAHSFMIRATVNGADTPGMITSVRLKQGSHRVLELDERQLMQSGFIYSRRPWNVEKMNLGITQLTNSTGGTTDGTVSPVSATPTKAEIDNNFAEVTTKLNAVLAELNGKARAFNPRVSTKSNLRAVYHVVVPTDGYLLDSLNTAGGGNPVLEMTISGACTVDVMTRTLSAVDRAAAAGRRGKKAA